MARRNRRATRPARREAVSERRAAVQETAREASRDTQRARARGRVVRAGAPRAVGEASPALERTAHLERAFVVKDFRRLVITVGAMLALLAASGFAVNALIP
ncbi:MAG TPA: hypothetical protein VFW12_06845 [Candidatus Limnocylindria bacterium]|nr:hypothetical protein [Candidatus Limnocylindria bacterium]